ncbi:metal-sensing transcriptional repressor [Acholeplasma granularum]|uniref:metal-sensing transcriptional repressor n=1 Tax=Acholeplasma granularum TaxID=264635 RepID=UPI00047286D7|nr:metal-sensing transcriptional repressor [Acholeplasma granularum]
MKCDISIVNRLKRSQGQMNGVLKLIENEATCEEIVMQLKAIRSSVDRIIGLITTSNLVQKIELENQVDLKGIDEALNLLIKSI